MDARVLVVDDDDEVRTLLERALRRRGFTVETARVQDRLIAEAALREILGLIRRAVSAFHSQTLRAMPCPRK